LGSGSGALNDTIKESVPQGEASGWTASVLNRGWGRRLGAAPAIGVLAGCDAYEQARVGRLPTLLKPPVQSQE